MPVREKALAIPLSCCGLPLKDAAHEFPQLFPSLDDAEFRRQQVPDERRFQTLLRLCTTWGPVEREWDVEWSKMVNEKSSDNVRNLEACVTEAGGALGERVQSATAATAAAAGQAQKTVEDAAAAGADQAKKALGDAGEAAQQAWSQAGGVAEDVVDAGRRATRSVSRQIGEKPLIAVPVGFALGYVAGLWIQGGSRPGRAADDHVASPEIALGWPSFLAAISAQSPAPVAA